MSYKPRSFYSYFKPEPPKPKETVMVYFRNKDGSLGKISAETEDYQDAILAVKEAFVETNVGFTEPVVALIKGGNK